MAVHCSCDLCGSMIDKDENAGVVRIIQRNTVQADVFGNQAASDQFDCCLNCILSIKIAFRERKRAHKTQTTQRV